MQMALGAATGSSVGTFRRALLVVSAAAVTISGSPARASAAGGSSAVGWGFNKAGQLGAGYRSGRQLSPVPVVGLSNLKAVDAGYHFSIVLLSDGTLRAWGGNDKGQLGD